ncbi:MAG: [protein-PII] uridylyltransferase [Sphingomonadaceae bacterium]
MPTRPIKLPRQRAIIDRRRLAERLGRRADRKEAVGILSESLARGREEIARRLEERPSAGTEAATAYSFLTDQIVRLVHDHIVATRYPRPNPTAGERLCLAAVGGYGRGEMALHSDVDLSFVTPIRPSPWAENVAEAMLYMLWDLGLAVGHSLRSIGDIVRLSADDHSVRTAMLESRYVWGDGEVFDAAQARFWSEVVAGNSAAFVSEKLDERNRRHERMGDSRYVVEPDVKDGKGGLRDLHALFWIAKYAYEVKTVAELVDKGLIEPRELRQFERAERFLWAVRCHLHIVAGRREERLTFDVQKRIAERMNYAERPGKSAVERFMQHYFLHAKMVGDLTGVFLAHLDEKFARRGLRFNLPAIRRRPRKLSGFMLERGRLVVPSEDFFEEDPVRLVELFALADEHELEIHPLALRAARRDARLIDNDVREDPRANRLFLQVLTSPRDPETVLRWMNEAGVFGRFVPDFGRVVAQMQFDMYHHYTVDEHTIRAIGLLSRIERGELRKDHPLCTGLIKHIASRRALYVAVLLHDIAKGRKGDHSKLGEKIARRLCPRLGLTPAETETVAWLVRWHLLLSATAFKRDLSDPKTIADFAARVKSPERLRLLAILTVVDIRAVGPGVWNSWKSQLLRTLFEATEERLRLGHKERGRAARVKAIRAELRRRLGWSEERFGSFAARFADGYWLSEPPDILALNARQIAECGEASRCSVEIGIDGTRGATRVSVYTPDQPGLFYRLTAAISFAGANIIDARIHTTGDGWALDNFLVHDAGERPFSEPHQLARLRQAIERAVAREGPPIERLEAKPPQRLRAEAFRISPIAFTDNSASTRYTVIEVNARDRPALLAALAKALFECSVTVHSAHIATYGERAVDVFYLTEKEGGKIEDMDRLAALERSLTEAAAESPARAAA